MTWSTYVQDYPNLTLGPMDYTGYMEVDWSKVLISHCRPGKGCELYDSAISSFFRKNIEPGAERTHGRFGYPIIIDREGPDALARKMLFQHHQKVIADVVEEATNTINRFFGDDFDLRDKHDTLVQKFGFAVVIPWGYYNADDREKLYKRLREGIDEEWVASLQEDIKEKKKRIKAENRSKRINNPKPLQPKTQQKITRPPPRQSSRNKMPRT